MKQQPRIARDRNRAASAARVWARVSDHPRMGIALVALVAAIVSCYPVVFFGKSFVSPNNSGATLLLYPTFPTLPGYNSTSIEDSQGSDIGAMMWAYLPYSVVESRAIFEQVELPLWDRYNSAGVPLLGQGQSMLSDLLHSIVLLAGGAPWAWDLKYVLAKFFFAFGVGLMVFSATRHVGVSLLLAFSSAFIGFFAYRFNHPAFFSLCYAPWILYCWFGMTQASSNRSGMLWLGGLTLANWMEISSGTIKEAYMLLVFLNLCGFLVWLLAEGDRRTKMRQGLQIICVGLLFALISAPLWLTFLDTLGQSYTSSNAPSVRQIPPSLLIGFFDGMFYRQFKQFNPSANFLVLLGVVWSLVRVNDLRRNPIYLAVGASAVVPFLLAFSLVPPSMIVRVPFLRNVMHIDNTFSCVLMLHLFVLAGFGFNAFWQGLGLEGWWRDWATSLLILGGLLGVYFGMAATTPDSAFFYGYGASLVAAFVALPVLVRAITLSHAPVSGAWLLVILALLAVHWRHGMHISTGFDDYVMNPQVRVSFTPKSPAVESIKAELAEPVRVVGVWPALFPGFSGVLGIESINGPDALMNPYYKELIERSGIERVWDWLIIVRGDTLAQLRPIYDFLNVKYYLATPLRGAEGRQGRDPNLEVYRSNSVWPRAFFADAITQYDAVPEFVDMIQRGDGRPFAAVQHDALEQMPSLTRLLADQRDRQIVPATAYTLTNNRTAFTVKASKPGIIVLSEAYLDHDFQATVNGRAVPYFRVNHAFKGISVNEAGVYRVSFSYWPRYISMSFFLAGAGFMVLLAWLLWTGMRLGDRATVAAGASGPADRDIRSR